jgi:hypothetical protein
MRDSIMPQKKWTFDRLTLQMFDDLQTIRDVFE